jgi:hypothetical protein
VPTIEDRIESERQLKVAELKLSGKEGTKITPETFAEWQAKKRQRKLDENKKRVEAEFKKKKGGKGLSVLSGRDLYAYKRELFDKVDDDDENNAFDPIEFKRQDSLNNLAELAENVKEDLFLGEGGEDDDLDDLDDD